MRQAAAVPDALALAKAGRRRAARIAMMAMTTSNSMSVKARFINHKLAANTPQVKY